MTDVSLLLQQRRATVTDDHDQMSELRGIQKSQLLDRCLPKAIDDKLAARADENA